MNRASYASQWRHYLPHHSDTLRLGFPLIIGQLGQIVLTLVDSAMIGRYGAPELAAASFCINLFNLPIFFALGFGYALTPMVGGATARGDLPFARQILRVGLRANLLLALLLMAVMMLMFLAIPWMRQPEHLIPLIRPYFVTQLLSLPALTAFNAFKQYCDGQGRTRIAMWWLIGGNALNIVGNYMLIYGACGTPELGLLGAGLSTLISRWIIAAGLWLAIQREWKANPLPLAPKTPETASLVWRDGTLIASQMALESGLFALSVIIVGWQGELPLAAHHVAITLQTLGFMTYYGLSAAVSIRVSHYWGLGQRGNAQRAARAGLHLAWGIAAIVMLAFWLLRYHLPWYFTKEANVALLTADILLVAILYQPFDALQALYANALRGVGGAKPLMLSALVGYILVALPLAYLFGEVLSWGVRGVWLAFPVGLGGAGIGYWWAFRRACRGTTPAL